MLFNSDETTYLQFIDSLNSNSFHLVEQVDIRKIIDELKLKGKVCEEVHMDDEMCKALGIRILRNELSYSGTTVEIYLFFSERFPQEPPIISVSESLVDTDSAGQEEFRYKFANPDEFKKDGVINVVGMLERVQNDVMKKISKGKFVKDLNQLKDSYNISEAFKALSQLKLSNLIKDTRNPSAEEVMQQFKLTEQYLKVAGFFMQLTQLNDRIINYLREKNDAIERQKRRNIEICMRVDEGKKQFAEACMSLQKVKERFSKLSIMGVLNDRIDKLKARADRLSKEPFSSEVFQEYKTVMKELKLIELKKQKMI